MAERPPAPYPVGTPDYWASDTLEIGIRGPGTLWYVSDGDFHFESARWQTVHGPATAYRTDSGAHMVWDAQLPDGRRVHCRKSSLYGPGGTWRRRSDDGRSWVVGEIKFEPDDVRFTDNADFRPRIELKDNVFEAAMANQSSFIRELQDDSFAFTLNRYLWGDDLCTADGSAGWGPSRGEAADTIARLRGFGETYHEFKFGGPNPEPPWTDRSIIEDALAVAGWRFASTDESRRLFPQRRP